LEGGVGLRQDESKVGYNFRLPGYLRCEDIILKGGAKKTILYLFKSIWDYVRAFWVDPDIKSM